MKKTERFDAEEMKVKMDWTISNLIRESNERAYEWLRYASLKKLTKFLWKIK